MSATVPVLVTAFRRPDELGRCLRSISAAGAERVYISVDGPRVDVPDDADLIGHVLEVAEAFARTCDCSIRAAAENGGLGRGVTDGLDWFFSHESRGVVIEEDVLVSPGSLALADRMLDRVDDGSAGSITLFGPVPRKRLSEPSSSYRFSVLPSSQYWGTNRACWSQRPVDVPEWRSLVPEDRLSSMGGAAFASFWTAVFDEEAARGYWTWEHQWNLTHWANDWRIVASNENHCLHIGYNALASNSFEQPTWYPKAMVPFLPPAVDPSSVLPDASADRWLMNQRFGLSRGKAAKRAIARRVPWLRTQWRRLQGVAR